MSDHDPRTTIDCRDGMLAYLVGQTRPALAARIAETNRIETAVIGLGRQGSRHAGLMRDFGTAVVAGVSPGQGGMRVQETIPVFDTVADMLAVHADVAAVSIWKHYSTAAAAAIEAMEAGIPLVVLISEGIPVRDVRKVVATARRTNALLLGPNTPGVIFPPERVKIGMLPDVFYPAEPEPGRFSASGVSICSRSGAILYHMSDALASAGIAQNAVIGVGGDSLIGSAFPKIVPLAMGFDKTDLVVVAGEIGGCQEELLAEAIRAHPERFEKPMVALISGRCAPQGKTMGHAGAIVAPGVAYGTYRSKRRALQEAGVKVVNNQTDLIAAVSEALGVGKTYFLPQRYYERMRQIWEAPAPIETWTTSVTNVEPNLLSIRDVPLAELIGRRSLLEVMHLLVAGTLPDAKALTELERVALDSVRTPLPALATVGGGDADISKQLGALLLADPTLATFSGGDAQRAASCLGRVAAAMATIFGHTLPSSGSFGSLACHALAGENATSADSARMLEAAMVASVDHGVTPPSAQVTVLTASVRAAFEVSIACGVAAITDVHGGAGAKAAQFFAECRDRAQGSDRSPAEITEVVIAERMKLGDRVEGLGHRVHTLDPRRDALWSLAEETGIAGQCVAISREVEDAFSAVRGMTLPVNVDGVIGAIVADMGLDPRVAKALFIVGRVAGLAAHYFEECQTQLPMRRIDFDRAIYRKGDSIDC